MLCSRTTISLLGALLPSCRVQAEDALQLLTLEDFVTAPLGTLERYAPSEIHDERLSDLFVLVAKLARSPSHPFRASARPGSKGAEKALQGQGPRADLLFDERLPVRHIHPQAALYLLPDHPLCRLLQSDHEVPCQSWLV